MGRQATSSVADTRMSPRYIAAMKSPFPGMDPYLETHWEGVHQRLIVYACDSLQPRLPDDLRARLEERVFVESDLEPVRHVMPDVHVTQVYPQPESEPAMLKEAGLEIAEPLVFDLFELEITEGYITIREQGGGKVITVIEFLSLANKRAGAGREKYLQKQSEVLQTDASLVEIDLVRGGQRVLALPHCDIPVQHRRDYLACVSPGWKRKRRELYTMPLRQRLSVLPIPLRQHERSVPLDLQALVDHAYAAGRYSDLNYASELDPPLPAEDLAWAADLLRAAGRR